MTDIFDIALDFVLEHEGGLVDDPNDPGGLTNMGISIRFGREIGLIEDDIREMTKEYASQIYEVHFWQRCSCFILPERLALMLPC